MSRTPQSPFPCAPSDCHAARPADHGESGSFGLVTSDYDTFPTQRDDARVIARAAYRSTVPRYLSPEWFSAANAAAASRRLDSVDLVLLQVITGGPEGDVRYRVSIEGGHITLSADSADHAGAAEHADATFTEDYSTAVAVFRGELSPQDALTQGRVRVAGNMAAIVAHQPALAELGAVFDDMRAATTF